MLELDGSGGGGQLLRSALACSALTGQGFRMTGVRGGRSTPGLRPQHLAAVRAMAAICDADVDGDEQGSEAVAFRPGAIQPGEYEVDVGTAGSLTLLFDAVLPLATRIDAPLSLTATGGTDVRWSPPMDYLRRVKLPLLRRAGLGTAVDVDRRGFYPAGGGRATLRCWPSALSALDLAERGDRDGVRLYSTATTDLADADVAERQAATAADALAADGATVVERRASYVDAESPGSALVVRADYGNTAAGFDALGERGKPAEDVAREAVDAATGFHDGNAAVDEHLADQVLVLLGLGGGRVRIPAVTDHVESSLDLVGRFGLDVTVERDGEADGPLLVGRA